MTLGGIAGARTDKFASIPDEQGKHVKQVRSHRASVARTSADHLHRDRTPTHATIGCVCRYVPIGPGHSLSLDHHSHRTTHCTCIDRTNARALILRAPNLTTGDILPGMRQHQRSSTLTLDGGIASRLLIETNHREPRSRADRSNIVATSRHHDSPHVYCHRQQSPSNAALFPSILQRYTYIQHPLLSVRKNTVRTDTHPHFRHKASQA
jgi:hypothetical protein